MYEQKPWDCMVPLMLQPHVLILHEESDIERVHPISHAQDQRIADITFESYLSLSNTSVVKDPGTNEFTKAHNTL